jgi:pimeloyl-ACP methyl ester carboxylesterase
MRTWLAAVIVALGLSASAVGKPLPLPPAIYTDPPADAAHPARSEVLHIPTGRAGGAVAINGLAYVAAGPGAHPTLVLLHGYPGNEKNLDLAQAVRRAGWNVVTFNYRGSWGSPGSFRFANVAQDPAAVLAYLRRPEIAAKLQIDTHRLVIGGHSMGGWATAITAAADPDLKGAILISAADMATSGATRTPAELTALAADSSESLADVTPQSMAADMAGLSPKLAFPALAPGLARQPLLVLTSDDGLAPSADKLAAAVRAHHGQVTTVHAATDHSWNGKRILLEAEIIRWLQALPR